MTLHELLKRTTENLGFVFETDFGFSHPTAIATGQIIMLIALMIVIYVIYRVAVFTIRRSIIPILQRTRTKFDDLLLEHKFFRNFAILLPAYLVYTYLGDVMSGFLGFVNFVLSVTEAFFIVILIAVSNSILNTINDYYNRYDFAKDHPIVGVIQIIKIISYIMALIMIVAILFDRDLSSLVVGLGTISAVLMLIFKDPILGFVGGLQLIFNKMLSIEDWITMPKFGADGKVKEINLTTVKVQNWDKTIVTIPTYSLITDSFQNWKGMEDAGGRRIKRAINIDMKSVRFCTKEMLDEFKKIKVLEDYIVKTEEKVASYNSENKIDSTVLVNGRRQTNIGVFRAYLENYLKNRADIHKGFTFMVRQLPPSEKGLPIEIYVFTSTTNWVEYEGIQADIFDHVLAVIPEFGLQVYQFPTDRMVELN